MSLVFGLAPPSFQKLLVMPLLGARHSSSLGDPVVAEENQSSSLMSLYSSKADR